MAMTQPIVTKSGKRKRVIAELLAVFLGPWTWLYTFRKDRWKFIVSLLAICPGVLLFILICIDSLIGRGSVLPNGEDAWGIVFFFWLYLVPISVIFWIWAIIDVLLRKPQWYTE